MTARNRTLQVIHLTVKDFLTSSHDLTTTLYSELLIDSRSASLQLILVCLRCIEMSCLEPLVGLDSGVHRIDLKLDPAVLLKRRLDNPLVEYGCFSWIVHLTDRNTEDINEVACVFQQAFDSSLTFTWLDICLALQPDSVLRLLVGLEEISDWISDVTRNQKHDGETGYQFLARWCMTLQELLREYGAILVQRP